MANNTEEKDQKIIVLDVSWGLAVFVGLYIFLVGSFALETAKILMGG